MQRSIANSFIALVNANEFEKAFELTQKNMYTGKTLEAFKDKALREIRGSAYIFDSVHPLQNNGNRLRRWLKGAEVEMQDISIEFTGPSLLRITLRYQGNKQWKIFFITSHAG